MEIVHIIIIVSSICLIFYFLYKIHKYKNSQIESYENNEPIENPETTFDEKNNFIAITYENTNDDNTKKLIELYNKFKYNYKVLGIGLKWEGWYGRAKTYQEYINTLNDDKYVLINDGRDVLVNEEFNSFFDKAKKMYERENKLVIGTEFNCCAGIDTIDKDNFEDKSKPVIEIIKEFMKNECYKKIPDYKYDYFYINFGLLFGKAKDFKQLFVDLNIRPGIDDQASTQYLFYKNPERFYLDYNQELFSNMVYFCDYEWDNKMNMITHTKTKTYPSLLHFPGKNTSCYNKIYEKIINNHNNKNKVTDNDILIYIVYHDDDSYDKIKQYENNPSLKLIKIKQTKYFESVIFDHLEENKQEWENKKYVGVLTYSFERKKNKNILDIINKIKEREYNLNNLFHFENLDIYKNYRHVNMQDILTVTLQKMNINFDFTNKNIIFYCNYFVTTPELMKEYIIFLKKIKEIYETEPLNTILFDNAQYIEGALKPEKLIIMTGKPYYTYHCFVVERLAPIFFAYKNVNYVKCD